MTRRLLVLRPQPGADESVTQARAAGFDAVACPLFAVRPLEWTPPDPAMFDAIFFTSANAPRHAGNGLQGFVHLPAYAVGAATATAARDRGFDDIVTGDADAESIARRIATDGHIHALHLHGRETRAFDPGPLHVASVAVYASEPAGDTATVAAALVPGAVLLVHSPRAGARLAALVPREMRRELHVVAISANALHACGSGWASARAASRPDSASMIALARSGRAHD